MMLWLLCFGPEKNRALGAHALDEEEAEEADAGGTIRVGPFAPVPARLWLGLCSAPAPARAPARERTGL